MTTDKAIDLQAHLEKWLVDPGSLTDENRSFLEVIIKQVEHSVLRYVSLEKSAHASVARSLETEFPELGANFFDRPELVGEHFAVVAAKIDCKREGNAV